MQNRAIETGTPGAAPALSPQPPEIVFYDKKGLTIEEAKALYFNSEAILTEPEPVYRVKSNGDYRFYFTFDREIFRPEFFISISSFIDKSMPTPPHLIKWIAEMGWEKAEAYKLERAGYGTLIHIMFAEFIIQRHFDFDTLDGRVLSYVIEKSFDINYRRWADELKKDITAFAQFCLDYEVAPLAIEIMLVSREMGVGGILDLVCLMNAEKYTEKTPKAQRRRVRAIIDFKGSKSGFYESNEVQLFACKQLWHENFPEYPIDIVANWAGKNWLKAPTYTFENHTGKPSEQLIQYLIEIGKVRQFEPDRTMRVFSGVMEFGKPFDKNVEILELEKVITQEMISRL